MIKAIPKWIMIRYSVLYRNFKTKSFTRIEANEVLGKHSLNSDDKLTNVFFSDLNEKGWVEVKRDKIDARKKIYRLITPEKAMLELEIKDDKE